MFQASNSCYNPREITQNKITLPTEQFLYNLLTEESNHCGEFGYSNAGFTSLVK